MARRERWELRGKRAPVASQVETEEMDKRVKSAASVHLAAKETQAAEVLMVILVMLASVVLLELRERREMLVALADLAHLEKVELLDQRVRGAVQVHLANLGRKETLGLLDNLDLPESQEEEGTLDQRVLRGQADLQVKRVKLDQRVCEDFQVNLEAKGRGAIQVCLAPEDHQEPVESLDVMAPEVILVMLDQEVTLAPQDQKEKLEDLALALLEQGG